VKNADFCKKRRFLQNADFCKTLIFAKMPIFAKKSQLFAKTPMYKYFSQKTPIFGKVLEKFLQT
jgi:hypothetical protein